MSSRFRFRFCALALGLALSAPLMHAATVSQALQLALPDGLKVPYSGVQASAFAAGLPLGVGAGLSFAGVQADGSWLFYSLTDRGPNADAPDWRQGQDKLSGKIFVAPGFTPQILPIRIKDGQVSVGEPILLHDDKGPIHGLPLPVGTVGSTHEMALTDDLKAIASPDGRGLDSEGLALAADGSFWLCDEYGPFLIHADAQGKILQKWGPEPQAGEQAVAGGLPGVIAWRQANRGFEGLALLPSGKVIAAVQSTLDIDGKTAKTAPILRLVELDPATGQTRMLAYPLEEGFYKKAKDAKIGDLVAVDEQTLLIIEQGKDKDKQMHNRIYKLSLQGATDLTGVQVDGKAPEFASLAAVTAAGVVPVQKELLLDLRDLGWQPEKAEGLTLIDAQTLAVSNDNDFGLDVTIVDPVKDEKDPTEYQTDGTGQLLMDGKPVTSRLLTRPLSAADAASHLWIIKLDKPLY